MAKFSGLMHTKLLGIDYSIGNEETLNRLIFDHLAAQSPRTLFAAHINMHGLALCRKNSDMKDYIQASDFHWVDGMPVISFLRLLKFNISFDWRLTFLDWQHSFFKLADKNKLKIFLLGSDKDSIEAAARSLRNRYPNVILAHHHGYISSENETQEVVHLENDFKPDILLLGMGMPIQETWALKNQLDLTAKVVLPIGGYFDYIAGATITPPRWMGRYGLEWAGRLIADPKKLSYRYLIEPIPVFFDFLIELFLKRLFNK
jgi:N-acetylglucosaminyldiphosphoundecaprenol N-acetyl-beta-D-mannosaminyltransferase